MCRARRGDPASIDVNPCEICVGKVALGQGFLRILRISAVNNFPPMIVSNFHLYVCCYHWEKRAKPGDLLERNRLSEIVSVG